MIGTVIACLFIGFLFGFISGGHYGIDSCSKNIEDTVILEHIKNVSSKTKFLMKIKLISQKIFY